jgi:hypothetical protein
MAWVQKIISFIFVALIAIIVGSCQAQKASDKDPLDEGYKKIDQGDYDGAILNLQDLSSRDLRPAVKLSSAYAARAGVKVDKLWDFVQALKSPPVTDEQVKKNSVYVDNQQLLMTYSSLLGGSLKQNLELLSKVMSAFDLFRSRIESLPYVAYEKRADLVAGAKVLDKVDTKGAHLYRSVLNLVILRSDLKDGGEVWSDLQDRIKEIDTAHAKSAHNQEILCSLQLDKLSDWLGREFDQARGISEDLTVAFPSKSKELIEFDFAVAAYQQELPSMKRSLKPEACHDTN